MGKCYFTAELTSMGIDEKFFYVSWFKDLFLLETMCKYLSFKRKAFFFLLETQI